ncbi:MAG: Crp/Fnr family transcriptional regulator [Paracoccaceae bacterium]
MPQTPPLWCTANDLYRALEPDAKALLEGANSMGANKGDVLFRPDDEVQGFILLLSGHVGVYLTGQGGRGILLYDIRRGQTCIQTTLGLMGGDAYSAEAVCESDCAFVLLPRAMFDKLLQSSPVFRTYVFSSFSERMQNMMRLLEQVAFVRIEARLATALLDRANGDNQIKATHQELATVIGSAREVISRRLEGFAKQNVVKLDRGVVTIIDFDTLKELSQTV